MKTIMTLTWYRHFGSKVPAVTVTVFKYRNNIGKIVLKAVPYSVLRKKNSRQVAYNQSMGFAINISHAQ